MLEMTSFTKIFKILKIFIIIKTNIELKIFLVKNLLF